MLAITHAKKIPDAGVEQLSAPGSDVIHFTVERESHRVFNVRGLLVDRPDDFLATMDCDCDEGKQGYICPDKVKVIMRCKPSALDAAMGLCRVCDGGAAAAAAAGPGPATAAGPAAAAGPGPAAAAAAPVVDRSLDDMLAEWDDRCADFKLMVQSLPAELRVAAVVSAMPFATAAKNKAQSFRGGAAQLPHTSLVRRPDGIQSNSVKRVKPGIEQGSSRRQRGETAATTAAPMAPLVSTKKVEEQRKERKRNKKQGPSGVLHRQAKAAKLEEVGPVEYILPATSLNAFVTLVS